MDRAQYEAFIDALLAAEKTEFKDWERDTPYFEGCLPIEVMAERGRETLRFGPMKPVGLTNPHAPDIKPHAIVQLRRDNALGTLFNIVGFQTKMKYGAQAEVLRTIPGLENAAFARLGGIHRNTFLNSPRLLDGAMRLRADPRLRFAGQITGVEGYVESAAMGLLAGRLAAAERLRAPLAPPPPTTAMGALVTHITGGADAKTFQPMNVNFGLFPPLDAARGGRKGRKERYKGYTDRAKADFASVAGADVGIGLSVFRGSVGRPLHRDLLPCQSPDITTMCRRVICVVSVIGRTGRHGFTASTFRNGRPFAQTFATWQGSATSTGLRQRGCHPMHLSKPSEAWRVKLSPL